MKTIPLVSVVIPCYQAEKYVRDAIDSVASQTYGNVEVIVIDDGSTDKSLSILKEYEGAITILQHPGGVNLGVSLTRKLGVDHAKGKYIAFLDADDCFELRKINAQVDALEKNKTAVLCHTAISLIRENSKNYDLEGIFNYSEEIEIYNLQKLNTYIVSNRICNSSVVMRADVLKKIPFYGKQMYQYEDWLTWVLAAEYGKFIYLPDKLTKYRLHEASSTGKILDSDIAQNYSRIELYTSIISRNISRKANRKSAYQLLKAIDSLRDDYATDSSGIERPNMTKPIPFLLVSVKYALYKTPVFNRLHRIFLELFRH